MEIRSISQKIFKSGQNSKVENNSRQTNPFGVNFQGNIIKADVFERSEAKLGQKIAQKGKMLSSAIVGSINSVNKAISQRLDSVVRVGKNLRQNVLKAGERVSSLWAQAKSIEISLGMPKMRDLALIPNEYNITRLSKKEPSALGDLLREEIALRQRG